MASLRKLVEVAFGTNPVTAPITEAIFGGEEPKEVTAPAPEPTPLMPVPDEKQRKIQAQKRLVRRRAKGLTRANTMLSDPQNTGLGG